MALSKSAQLRNGLLASWKRLLSFRKHDWELGDYPVAVRKQLPDVNSGGVGQRFSSHPNVAYIIRWPGLVGTGDSPEAARLKLAENFAAVKKSRIQECKQLPRPGVEVPIQFASDQRVSANQRLRDDFIHRVLELDWAWISDESSLWDFHGDLDNERLNAKIAEIYDVDVRDIPSAKLCDILDRIAARQQMTSQLSTPSQNQ